MLHKTISIAIFLLFLSPVAIKPHGDEKEVKKVTAATIMHQDGDDDHDHEYRDSLEQVENQKSMNKDFAEIKEDVANSAVPTVIKALSLAIIIAGLAFLFIPRKKEGGTNV